MSELLQSVGSLEDKVAKLLHKLELLRQTNTNLVEQISVLKDDQSTAINKVADWEEKYNSLKMANSMLGSNTDKTEAKLKINTLIRELDHCITQLSE